MDLKIFKLKISYLILILSIIQGCKLDIQFEFEDTEFEYSREVKNKFNQIDIPKDYTLTNSDSTNIINSVKFWYNQGNSDSISIQFEHHFNNDDIKVIVGEEVVFNDKISTEEMVGLAKIIKTKKVVNYKTPMVFIGKKKINLSKTALKKYDVVRFTKRDHNINVRYQNKIPLYF